VEIDISDPAFFYQNMAVGFADQILDVIKSNCKEYFDYSFWEYNHPIDSEDMTVGIKLNVVRSKACTSKYDIWASAGLDESAELCVNITVVMPPKVWQKNVSIDKAELVGILSHELHHIAQSNCLDSYPANMKKGKMSYFLDPFEVEAFHIGFRAQSFFSGESFEDLASRYIELTAPNLDRDKINFVVKTWQQTKFEMFESCRT